MPNVHITQKEVRAVIFKAAKGRCFYCDRKVKEDGKNSDETFVVDRLTPKKRGGTDDFSNLVCSCQSCNTSKGNRTMKEYVAYLKEQGRMTTKLFGKMGGLATRDKFGNEHFKKLAQKRWANR